MICVLPHPGLFFGVALALAFVDEFYILLFLLAGYSLFNRNFAYVHLQVNDIPFYITEFCLLIWVARVFIVRRQAAVAAWKKIPRPVFWSWLALSLVGLLSLIRGLASFPAVAVLRDAAVVYYSAVFWLVAALPLSSRKVKMASYTLLITTFIRAVSGLMLAFGPPTLTPAVLPFYGQAAGGSMSIALCILGVIVAVVYRSFSPYLSICCMVIGCEFLIEAVRSAWTGMLAGLFPVLWFCGSQIKGIAAIKKPLQLFVCLVVIPASLIYMLSLRHSETMPTPTGTPAVVKEYQTLTSPNTTTPPANTVATAAAPVSVPRKAPSAAVASSIASFFHGIESKNVLTRFWLWQDAVSEVFSIGLFSPALTPKDLTKYHLPTVFDDSAGSLVRIHPTKGTHIEHLSVTLYFSNHWGDKPWSIKRIIERSTQALIGLPFGKLFLPPQIVYCVISPNRYDPHNSFIGVLYRTGLIGLISLLSLYYFILQTLCSYIRRNMKRHDWRTALHIILLAGILYHSVHSLTDNTLENPFKGIWLWTMFGLIFAVEQVVDDLKPDSQS